MAESQVPYNYNDNDTGAALINTLSETRFKPYLVSAGRDQDYAFALYLYNARMAKAFLYPLHILEITLRNRINDIFCDVFNEDWCHDSAFQQVLTAESLSTLNRGIGRSKSRATADVVATLTFDFWSNLFREEYDRSLWQTKMHNLLPHVSKTRSEFQRAVREINHFRNRIAHHEPVYKLNLSQTHADLTEMISWLSAEACQWVKHFSTVNQCLRTRPSGKNSSAPAVSEKADPDFCLIRLADKLDSVPAERFIACENEEDEIVAVIEMHHLARYLFSLQEENNLIVSLADHTFSDVVRHSKAARNLIICRTDENLYRATTKLTGKKQYIVVCGDNGPCGIIARAHRKY